MSLSWPARDEVQVLLVRFDATVTIAASLLTPDEETAAQKRGSAALAQQFRFGRAFRRAMLAQLVDVAPAALQIAEHQQGKPFLVGAPGRLRFNVSHAGELFALAVADGREIGLDVEATRQFEPKLPAVAFSPAEQRELASLPPSLVEAAFFTGFTRKEALVKAVGLGLRLPLDAFDVTVDPRLPARLLASRHPALDPAAWSLASLELGDGFAGALAVAGPPPSVTLRWLAADALGLAASP